MRKTIYPGTRRPTDLGLVVAIVLVCTFGCTSTNANSGASNVGFQTNPTKQTKERVLSKGDFDHIIKDRLSRRDTIEYLNNIAIEDYTIQDPNTNWAHASVGSADSRYSIYYLTYHQRYFILLLRDVGDRFANCIDAISGPITSSKYEIGMGPVEINHDHLDGRVVVIFNKKWKGNYSDDIIAAFKPNLETRQIEEFNYSYIKIFREE
jgi:hypothetical protein